MEKLWSPWRSQYIDSFSSAEKTEGCIFCEMKDKEVASVENLLVRKNKLTFTVLNLYPYNNGHLMVVPIRHLDSMIELNDDENLEIMNELQLAQKALKEIYSPDGFNLGANLGRVSGAGIADHIHFHIVPRWSGDTNFMPVLGEVKVISQDLLVTKNKLLEAYKKLTTR
ncbi:MAG: HIT domain-containing protein [Ignavibacteriales bacterium]|nr:MAG: HIT domain-containing protein [Ignavibacteriales bacterium]